MGLCEFAETLGASWPGKGVLVWGQNVGLMIGAMAWVVAVAMMCLGTVPHAMGRVLPLGLSSGMTRAGAAASSVVMEVWLVARRAPVCVSSCRVWVLCLTTE